jgi:hypothetical protein
MELLPSRWMTANRTMAWPVIAIRIFLPIEDVSICIAFLPFQDLILLGLTNICGGDFQVGILDIVPKKSNHFMYTGDNLTSDLYLRICDEIAFSDAFC